MEVSNMLLVISIILVIISIIMTVMDVIDSKKEGINLARLISMLSLSLITGFFWIVSLPISEPVLVVSEDRTGVLFKERILLERTEYSIRERDTDGYDWKKYNAGEIVLIRHNPTIVSYRNCFLFNKSPIIHSKLYLDEYGVKDEVIKYTESRGTITESWEEIVAAGENGSYTRKYKIGDTKELDLGTEGVVLMELVAMDKDMLADKKGKAHMTWIAKNLLNSNHSMNNEGTNEGGWTYSNMRSWLHEEILPLFPKKMRLSVKEVIKYSYSVTDQKETTSVDRIWIPSRKEIFRYSQEKSGSEYSEAFSDGGSWLKRRQDEDEPFWWWLRSASNRFEDGGFFCMTTNVDYPSFNPGYATNEGGVVICFCL